MPFEWDHQAGGPEPDEEGSLLTCSTVLAITDGPSAAASACQSTKLADIIIGKQALEGEKVVWDLLHLSVPGRATNSEYSNVPSPLNLKSGNEIVQPELVA